MVDEVGIGSVALGGGSRSNRRWRDVDESDLERLQREIREKQAYQRRVEQSQKHKELELAKTWEEHQQTVKQEKKQEVANRLTKLKAQHEKAERARRQRGSLEDQAQADIAAFSVCRTTSLAPKFGAEVTSEAECSADCTEVVAASLQDAEGVANVAPVGRGSASYGTSAATASRPAPKKALRKRMVEEADQEEKSVVQDLQDKLRQKLGFHTLVNHLFAAKDEAALFRLQGLQSPRGAEQDDDEASNDEAPPAAFQQHSVGRRHRLRRMRQVANQVLQCKKQMDGCFAMEWGEGLQAKGLGVGRAGYTGPTRHAAKCAGSARLPGLPNMVPSAALQNAVRPGGGDGSPRMQVIQGWVSREY